jgi:hypothetical protein
MRQTDQYEREVQALIHDLRDTRRAKGGMPAIAFVYTPARGVLAAAEQPRDPVLASGALEVIRQREAWRDPRRSLRACFRPLTSSPSIRTLFARPCRWERGRGRSLLTASTRGWPRGSSLPSRSVWRPSSWLMAWQNTGKRAARRALLVCSARSSRGWGPCKANTRKIAGCAPTLRSMISLILMRADRCRHFSERRAEGSSMPWEPRASPMVRPGFRAQRSVAMAFFAEGDRKPTCCAFLCRQNRARVINRRFTCQSSRGCLCFMNMPRVQTLALPGASGKRTDCHAHQQFDERSGRPRVSLLPTHGLTVGTARPERFAWLCLITKQRRTTTTKHTKATSR